MTGPGDGLRDLDALLAAICDQTAGPRDLQRLEALAGDPEGLKYVLDYLQLDGLLRWEYGAGTEEASSGQISGPASPVPAPAPLIPPIILDLSPTVRHWPGLLAAGGFVFSYVTAAVILAIGLFVGGMLKMTHDRDAARIAVTPAPTVAPPEKELRYVGRITGMEDCRWADPKIEISERDYVPLGREYALTAGLVEITYNTGAKVLLQGPATYTVESASSGYLALGKLTALVEKVGSAVELPNQLQASGAKGERTANPTPSQRGREPTASLALRLFSVRTPTALVMDFGTEFGVEVDRSGTSRARVFQGKVELQPTNAGNDRVPSAFGRETGGEGSDRAIRLDANESAVVEASPGRPVKVTRVTSQSLAPAFVRRLPRPAPVRVFGTGVGLAAGDPDPHWQLVAYSGAPDFEPQAAVVANPARIRVHDANPQSPTGTTSLPAYLPNNPARSQWVSTAGEMESLPDGTYTFRTTFEVRDVAPESVVVLGRFIVDNHVDAIRINGRAVSVPQHGISPPFNRFCPFTVDRGLVTGTNVLDIDVFNSLSSRGKATPMALRVELAARLADYTSPPQTPPKGRASP